MSYTSIARTIPTVMSVSLLEKNIRYLKNKKKKNLLKLGVSNIAGVSLIQATAQNTGW